MNTDLAPVLKALEKGFAAQASEYQGQAKVVVPAEQVVGFSHRPESDEEKIAVTEALARLISSIATQCSR